MYIGGLRFAVEPNQEEQNFRDVTAAIASQNSQIPRGPYDIVAQRREVLHRMSAKGGSLFPGAGYRTNRSASRCTIGNGIGMLPNHWLDFIFPNVIRDRPSWIDQFGKNRRFYLTGYWQAARYVNYRHSDDVYAGRSERFKEDPRRSVPFLGWRDQFRDHGETFVDGERYLVAPHDAKREKCVRWGTYGKDQPEHAWGYRPMRLYDALKSIVLLYDEAQRLGLEIDFHPHTDELSDVPPGIGIHVAIFRLAGFDEAYYDKHLRGEGQLLSALFEECNLLPNFYGQQVLTFEEMAKGMSATHRTCKKLQDFLKANNMPSVGSINADITSRGTNRRSRQKVKQDIRKGFFERYSADCAIEIFTI